MSDQPNRPESSESASDNCPHCGATLPASAPAGLCPACLLGVGMQPSGASEQLARDIPPTEASPVATPTGFIPPSVEEIGRRFPQWEVISLLGRGGMGFVYKARQPHLDRLVAIKILPAETVTDAAFAERFLREARALARLNHPHIVAVYDFGSAEGLCYFVMEYVDGVNLRQALHGGQLAPEQTLAIVPQICEALQYAHDEGVVHRDIKPENILIDKRGRVKIADFGLAKLLKADTLDRGLTGTHQVMGTPRYMAPEQLEGAKQVDHRADIYSLGVVFYELLTGELPIGRFQLPSKKVQIDVRLDEVVLRALEKEPDLRYQQASELKTSVEQVQQTPADGVMSPGARSAEPRRLELLLDATDDQGRLFQNGCLFVSLLVGFLGIMLLAGRFESPVANGFGGVALGLAGVLVAVAGYHRLHWETMYKGHRVVFENGVFSAERLYIDGIEAARGGFGYRLELRGTINSGAGAGERIVAWTEAGGWRHYRVRLFAETGPISSLALKGESAAAQPEPVTSRLAFLASLGAFWAIFGLVGIPLLVAIVVVAPYAYRVSLGVAEAFILLPLALPAVSAPVGATILGLVTIGQIKRSEGRLYGTRLAIFNALVFPLALVDLLILAAGLFLSTWLIVQLVPPPGPNSGLSPLPALAFDLLVFGSLAAWLDWRIARAVWRWATGWQQPVPPAPVAPPTPDQNLAIAATSHGGASPTTASAAYKLPPGFLARVTGAATVAWLAILLLWNTGFVGVAGGLACFAALIGYCGLQAQKLLPGDRRRWQHGGWLGRLTVVLFAPVFAWAGPYLLMLAGAVAWESINWNYAAINGEQFQQSYQGAEHRLLRNLPGFEKEIPRAELMPNGMNWTAGLPLGTNIEPHASMFGPVAIGFLIFLGLWLTFGAYATLLSSAKLLDFRADELWPALQLMIMTIQPTAAIGLVVFILSVTQSERWSGANKLVHLTGDLKTAGASVDVWAEANGFVSGDFFSWKVNEVPRGKNLASVELRHYWRPSVFDRWQMSPRGLRRGSPDIVIQMVSDAAGKHTVATVTARTRGSSEDPADVAANEPFDRLLSALNTRAANETPQTGAATHTNPLTQPAARPPVEPKPQPLAIARGASHAAQGEFEIRHGALYLKQGEPGLTAASLRLFNEPERPAYAIVFKHAVDWENMSGLQSCEGTADENSATIEHHFEHLGRKLSVRYELEVDLLARKIKREALVVDGRKIEPLTERLVVIDFTADPATVETESIWLSDDLNHLESADDTKARVPAILKQLRERSGRIDRLFTPK